MKQISSFSFKKCAVLFTFYSCVRLHYRNERYVVSKTINQWILWNKTKVKLATTLSCLFFHSLSLSLSVQITKGTIAWVDKSTFVGEDPPTTTQQKPGKFPWCHWTETPVDITWRQLLNWLTKKTKTINKYNLKVAWQMWRNPDSIKVTYNLNFTSKLLSCCSMLLSDVKQILFICSFVDNAQFSGQFAPWKMSLSA